MHNDGDVHHLQHGMSRCSLSSGTVTAAEICIRHRESMDWFMSCRLRVTLSLSLSGVELLAAQYLTGLSIISPRV